MQPPPQLLQWLRQTYPKPSVDENWLSQCYAWVIEEHSLNPATDMNKIKEQVEVQLLMSDLTDSMVHGTGLPHNVGGLQKGASSGPPLLVQIVALTEIGHSAFNLMNVRKTKIDRADLSGLTQGDGENDNENEADEGPVPKYPRAMLQFELSDGAMRLNAIEYKKIPQFDLENTPLGFKIQLKNVPIRHGIAFLEPKNIVLKGYSIEDLDENRDSNFLRGLRLRLDPHAQDEPEGERERREVQNPPAPEPEPVPAPAARSPPAPVPTPADVPDSRRTAQRPVEATAQPHMPPIPGPSTRAVQPPPPATINDPPRRLQPLVRTGVQRALPTNHRPPPPATSPHFSTPGPTMVAPMRLSPTRAPTEPLSDEPQEPGSDWYFGHDGIDASFLSRAASELERSEALLSQSSQQSITRLSQLQQEVIAIDDDDGDKENTLTGPGFMKRTLEQQVEVDGSVIDISAEIIEGPRTHRPIDNDDVISIGSDD